MTEVEYFGELEMRICREFGGMRDRKLRSFWCDGFMPERDFVRQEDNCEIRGRVWIVSGSVSQGCWDFVLSSGANIFDRHIVDWNRLIPGKDSTGWLSADFEKRILNINPSRAYRDRTLNTE